MSDAEAAAAVPFSEPYRLDSSVWVGNRLCEVLPVPLKAKQKLMELVDQEKSMAFSAVIEPSVPTHTSPVAAPGISMPSPVSPVTTVVKLSAAGFELASLT